MLLACWVSGWRAGLKRKASRWWDLGGSLLCPRRGRLQCWDSTKASQWWDLGETWVSQVWRLNDVGGWLRGWVVGAQMERFGEERAIEY
ncbi:uncharacterized protein DS421_9g260960 [Arachis hypogaea]|nr:uncharacterized protein DS421_9g260960 [Arachis hypogaea]